MPSTSDLPWAGCAPLGKTRSRLSSTCWGHFPICFLRISPLVLNPCRQRTLGFLTIPASLPIFSQFSEKKLWTLYTLRLFLFRYVWRFLNVKSPSFYVGTWNSEIYSSQILRVCKDASRGAYAALSIIVTRALLVLEWLVRNGRWRWHRLFSQRLWSAMWISCNVSCGSCIDLWAVGRELVQGFDVFINYVKLRPLPLDNPLL